MTAFLIYIICVLYKKYECSTSTTIHLAKAYLAYILTSPSKSCWVDGGYKVVLTLVLKQLKNVWRIICDVTNRTKSITMSQQGKLSKGKTTKGKPSNAGAKPKLF